MDGSNEILASTIFLARDCVGLLKIISLIGVDDRIAATHGLFVENEVKLSAIIGHKFNRVREAGFPCLEIGAQNDDS